MLAKRSRISSKNIENVIKLGKSYHVDNFYGKFSSNNVKNPRFAIVSSVKIEKTSVGRHLIKRRISSIIEKFFKKYPLTAKKPFDLVIFSKKGAPTLNFSQISLEIDKILEHVSKSF